MPPAPSSLDSNVIRWPFFTKVTVLVTAILLLAMPLLYALFLLVSGGFLVLSSLGALESWLLRPSWNPIQIIHSVALAAGVVVWVWFFRPLWMRRGKVSSSLRLHAADQPELFESVRLAVVSAHAPLPVEVSLDGGYSVQLKPTGLGGALGGSHRLIVGAGWISACSEGQLIADMAARLAQSPRGVSGRCFWLMQSVLDWLERVSAKVPEIKTESAMAPNMSAPGRKASGKKSKNKGELKRRVWAAFIWVTQRPIWIMAALAKVLSAPARKQVERAGDMVVVYLLGLEGLETLLNKRRQMVAVEDLVAERLQEGIVAGRLPDNLPLFRARQLDRVREEPMMDSLEARVRAAGKKATPGIIQSGTATASLVRRFSELCRQLTQMHYQQDMGLMLGQFRLVSGSDTKRKSSTSDSTVLDIQRYFGGLAHPLRSVCGLVRADAMAPDAAALPGQIAAIKERIEARADQFRMAQREWGMAWQRCRDLEMGRALALAGMPLDAGQFGIAAHDARLYEEELRGQRTIMEHSNEFLQSIEGELECRLAGVLGLLMGAPQESLTADLAQARNELPLWGAAYGELAARLPLLWSVLTWTDAFEALALDTDSTSFKHSGAADEIESCRAALDDLLPKLNQHLHALASGLDQVAAPMEPQSSIVAVLLKETGVETVPSDPIGRAALTVAIAEGFVTMHQTVFAWLCRTAEAAEECLLAGAATPAPAMGAYPTCHQNPASQAFTPAFAAA